MTVDRKRVENIGLPKKVLIAVFLLGHVCLLATGARSASNEGQIVFVRGDCIWVMDADGKNEKRLTDSGQDWFPVWSPDGREIAFPSWVNDPNLQGDMGDIYVINADGSNAKQITSGTGNDMHVSWSPDGNKLALFRQIRDQNGKNKSEAIYVMNVDGSNAKKLTEEDPLFFARYPKWAPDGEKIVFYRYVQGKANQVWVMNADGSDRKMLNNWGWYPAWSPNGRKIAFVSGRDAWNAWKSTDIYVMDTDGGNVEILTKPDSWSESYPTWSPDGTKIAFSSNRNGNYEIYVMNADGSNALQLTNTPQDELWGLNWTAFPWNVGPIGKYKRTWGWLKQNSE